MNWVKPQEISKGAIDRAGEILINPLRPKLDREKASEVVNYWRAVHSYPMHVFKIRLKNKSQLVDSNAFVAQRLKRVPAIVKKLIRPYDGRLPTMNLSQMQDLGGCRSVLTSVDLARKLCDNDYIHGALKHKLVKVKDYIKDPKEDGYRGIHLIYRYTSDKGKKEFNGLLVEVQIRSKLQHVWATAIETVDLFTKQAIKSNEGQKEWSEFFKLVSSAFAIIEDCPRVPKTPNDEVILYREIKRLEKELDVLEKMKGWREAMKIFSTIKKNRKFDYYLLELDTKKGELNIKAYTKKEEQKAIEDYAESEKVNQGNKQFDVVLVGVDTSIELEKAYPNYFVDSVDFLKHLEKIISKY